MVKSWRVAAALGLSVLLFIVLFVRAVPRVGTNALIAQVAGPETPTAPPRAVPTPPPLVPVPSGDFKMGSRGDALADGDEEPLHTVFLDAFQIDQYEVTNALYQQCVDAGQCHAPSNSSSSTRTRGAYYDTPALDNYPVTFVSWYDAEAYCQWVDRRLPTEAEWEKTARGTDGRIYPWGNEGEATRLNVSFSNSLPGGRTAVGSFPSGASPYGAMDMAGNVWEWVADWYAPGYYAQSPTRNPQGPALGSYKALRGGSWDNELAEARTANRDRADPGLSYGHLGFRCAQ